MSEKEDRSGKRRGEKKNATGSEPAAKQREDAPAAEQPAEGLAGERLRAARRAFEAGDFRRLREIGREIEQAGDAEEKRAARELVRRVRLDPAMLIALLVCAALFLGIAYVYVLR
jgi:DNA polymerase/3'-5' exonuclease PolX